MDTKIINLHIEWMKSIETEYRYIEQDSEEFDAFFEVAGAISGQVIGTAMGGWVAGSVLAAIFNKTGSKIDEKLGL